MTRLFASGTLETGAPQPRLGDALARRVVAGGFAAALQRATHARRERWLREYLDALVEKDQRELFTLQRPDVIAPLLEAAAARTARLFNASDLASPFALTRQTISAYLHHLENVFLIDRLSPVAQQPHQPPRQDAQASPDRYRSGEHAARRRSGHVINSSRFHRGIVVHDGERTLAFGDRLFAVP